MGIGQNWPGLQGGTSSTGDSNQIKKTRDYFEALIGLSEGPIKGLSNGRKSFYLGDTPLQDQAGNELFIEANNHGGLAINLNLSPGTASDPPVQFQLGGSSSSHSVGVPLYENLPVSRTGTTGAIDALEVRMVIQQLYNVTNDGQGPGTVDFGIEYKPHSSSSWIPLTDPYPYSFHGMYLSANAVEFRKMVPRLTGGDTYDVRVTKTSQESTSKSFREITWESWQEVVVGPFSAPYTAMMQINGHATNQISGLPAFKGIYDGMLLQIPTNYNPYTRVYTGVWDGTFKTDWTNNNAWILYNAIMDPRWGLNSYYSCTIDKYDIYDAGQWCDTLVSDGQSGSQPRFTFNAYITEAMNGGELITQIATSFNARVYDDLNGLLTLKIDRDDAAVALFTQENVVNGDFDYSYTDLNQRYNDITVTFLNPLLNYDQDRRRIFNQTDINANGTIPLDLALLGCTDQQQATRAGFYRLESALTEKEMVTFSTNRLAAQVQPFEVILIADRDMGYALHGRVKNLSGDRKTAFLRDAIYLEVGVSYAVNFDTKNGVLSATLVGAGTGNVTSLVFASALPAGVEDTTTFSLGGGSSYGLPKPYRVIKLTPDGVDQITILATEINRNKWLAIDNTTFLGQTNSSDKRIGTHVVAPTGFVVSLLTNTNGTHDLALSWTASTDVNLGRYKIEVSINGQEPAFLTETHSTQAFFRNVPDGATYTFFLYAINLLNFASDAVLASYTVTGPSTPVPVVTGLEIEGQGHNPVFVTKHVKFAWRVNTGQPADIEDQADIIAQDPLFKDFVFEVYDDSTGALVFRDWTQNPSYNFTYDMNVQSGGPRRHFLVQVRYRDIFNRMSAPAKLIVNNPPPAQITNMSGVNGPGTLAVTVPRSLDVDVQGYRFWQGAPGFTPNDSNLVYDGPNNRTDILSFPGQTVYVRAAAYDYYDTTTVNISNEFSFAVPLIDQNYLSNNINTILAGMDPTAIPYIDKILKSLVNDADAVDNSLLKLTLNINSVQAQLGAANASARIEMAALVTQNSAFAAIVGDVQAQFSSFNLASVNTQLIALAAQDTAFAGSLTTLSTTVGGHTTSISNFTTSINGIHAQWGVSINVDGAAVGMVRLDGGASSSTFDIVANNFRVYQGPGSYIAAFLITGGTAYLNVPLQAGSITASMLTAGVINVGTLIANNIIVTGHILNGNVTTGKIASQGATIHNDAEYTGPLTPTGGQLNTWVSLVSFTHVSVGSPITINGQFMLHNTDSGSPGTHRYGLRLLRNGSSIWPQVAPTYGTNGGSFNNQPINWVETPGAGNMVYDLQYNPDSVSCDAVNVVLQTDEIIR